VPSTLPQPGVRPLLDDVDEVVGTSKKSTDRHARMLTGRMFATSAGGAVVDEDEGVAASGSGLAWLGLASLARGRH